MSDGYQNSPLTDELGVDVAQRFQYIQDLYTTQQKIDEEIKQLSDQIEELPTMPEDLDYWINSFHNEFKMSDFKKIFEIKKRYEELSEIRASNKQKIKMFVIDGILLQLKEIEEKKPS